MKHGLDVQTISAEAARIKLQDPSADRIAIIAQVKAKYPNIGEGAFNTVLPGINNKRKRSLTRLIKSAKNTIKKEAKNVEDIKFIVYECVRCKREMKNEYQSEYHIIATLTSKKMSSLRQRRRRFELKSHRRNDICSNCSAA